MKKFLFLIFGLLIMSSASSNLLAMEGTTVVDSCEVEIVKRVINDSTVMLVAQVRSRDSVSYMWGNGETSQAIRVNREGEYCVRIKTSTGCTSGTCTKVELGNSKCEVKIVKRKLDDSTCVLSAHVDRRDSVSYMWSNGQTGPTIRVRGEGKYCVKIKTRDGCTAEDCIEVGDDDDCEVEIIKRKLNDSTCVLVAQVKTRDSVAFEWSNGASGPMIRVNKEGKYCVKIKTRDGCTAEDCIEVEFEDEDDCEVEIVKRDLNDSTCVLVAQVKTRDSVSYQWSNGETGPMIRVNKAGKYCVRIKTRDGCTDEDCIEVKLDDQRDCQTKIEVMHQLGVGAVLTARTKGASPFTYEWSTGDSTQSIKVIQGGTYCVVVTDSAGCVSKACARVKIKTDRPEKCRVKIKVERPDSNGVWVLTALTSGNGPHKYEWSTGETTESIRVKGEGIYCVTVKDSAGCIAKDCFKISLRANDQCKVIIQAKRLNDSTRVLRAHAIRAQAPVKYEWSTGETSPSIEVTGPGTYCVVITDATGCVARACYTWKTDQRDSCAVKIVERRVGRDKGVFLKAITSQNKKVKYEWSTGETTQEIQVKASGTYCVTITDEDGCQARACIDIRILGGRGPSAIQVFPNPFQDVINIEYSSPTGTSTQYIITDATGNVLLTGYLAGDMDSAQYIDAGSLKQGVYSLGLITEDGVKSMTIIKK